MTDNSQIQPADMDPATTHAPSAQEEEPSADNLQRISSEGVFELAPEEDLDVHPAAETYPILPDQLEKMVESLRVGGQMDPVTVYEGQILDGRTRNLARKALGLPLKCRRITDLNGLDPLEWVIRRNQAAGTVRHLSDSQRAPDRRRALRARLPT